MPDVQIDADARWHALHMKLEHVEQCAREEFGGSTRVALLLTLTQVVRGLMVEIDTLRKTQTHA